MTDGIPRAPAPATAYSYIRLSSKRQATADDKKKYRDGYRRQVELCDEYLTQNQHLTLDTSLKLHDIGVSGFRGANSAPKGEGKLAAFQRAVEEGRVAKGSYLLLESLDRMTRTQVNVAQAMLLNLVNSGIVVVSLTDRMTYRSAPDDPASQANFMYSVMTLMRAHEESRMKSKRLSATWEEKRRKVGATKLTGRCPGWLTLVGNEFELNEKRVAVVNEIMGYLADGWGRDRIAQRLNNDPDPDKRCWGHGRSWHGGTVQKLTDNRALIGEFQPHKLVFEERAGKLVGKRVPVGDPIPDYYPRVVSEELWVRARNVANSRKLGRAHNAGGQTGTVISNLFGSVAACAMCGQPMNYRDRGPRSTPVLRCSAERGGACTNAYRIPYEDTENAILSWLVTLDMSGGAPGEAARLAEDLRTAHASRGELQARGETIVAEFGLGNRFAKAPLADIERKIAEAEAAIIDLEGRIAVLKASGGRDEREMAVATLVTLRKRKAPEEEIVAVRLRIRQIVRDTFKSMDCYEDGLIEIGTIDGGTHRFRDGYWWHKESQAWLPWAGAMAGMGSRATKAELARRAAWLAEAEAARPPLRWDRERKEWTQE
ncbi:recombinase family protein [Methylobacterium aquaticum]|uniref:Site-specific recombinases, DNA invertase Pin homologs n=1 Tax=Methylobacterium aquaticum TaxID=270351 RepID=A0A0C6FSM8_9HYPH|nr:recombinase family protein [Methylobacterium aquaticum]BAQ45830.1 site-specific recombinases, DNA invertase Pin homologs [Methylobacterium aquaticum]